MLRFRPVAPLTIVVSLALAPIAAAQSDATGSPSAAAVTPAKKKRPKKLVVSNPDGPLTSFVGFRTLDDGSTRVYVDVAQTVPVDEKRDTGVLHYQLKGARVASRNSTNWLVTTHWNTPVKRARLVPNDGGVELVIELRAETTPTQRLVPGPHGGSTLQIDFPAGNFPALDEPMPETGKHRKKGAPASDELPNDLGGPPTDVLPVGPSN